MTELHLRPATPADTGLLLDFIRELAVFEAFPYAVTVTAGDLRANLFGPAPAAQALIGEVGGQPAAFAVFYETFSTTTGRRGLHLDDLFVRPAFQGQGHGRAVLRHLAAHAVARDCARFEWWSLRTNEPALRFYRSLGVRQLDELLVFRAQGDELRRLAD